MQHPSKEFDGALQCHVGCVGTQPVVPLTIVGRRRDAELADATWTEARRREKKSPSDPGGTPMATSIPQYLSTSLGCVLCVRRLRETFVEEESVSGFWVPLALPFARQLQWCSTTFATGH